MNEFYFVRGLSDFSLRPLVIITSVDVVGEEPCRVIRENVISNMVDGGFGVVLEVNEHENKEMVLHDGLDEIPSQSLNRYEEEKKVEEDAIGITDRFESGGPSLVVATTVQSRKGSMAGTCFGFCVWVCHVIQFGTPRYSDKLLILIDFY